jgi:hypothetical protein
MIFAKKSTDDPVKLAAAYRVWILTYGDWQPISCSDLPVAAVAWEEAEPRTFTLAEAARYVKSFNRTALAVAAGGGKKLWAVAFPVAVLYHGEPMPGQPLFQNSATTAAHKKSPPCVSQVSTRSGLSPRE